MHLITEKEENMRVYEPSEDLPPANQMVYALLEFENIICDEKKRIHEVIKFDPQIGWISEKYQNFKVIKWADYVPPNLDTDNQLECIQNEPKGEE